MRGTIRITRLMRDGGTLIARARGAPSRRLSSNPMFTHSPVPILPDEKYFRDPNCKDPDESFMSRHSGKIGVLALLSAVAMLYSYFKGNFNERDMEKEVADNQAVEAMEVNEVRFRGQGIQLSLYDALVLKAQQQFPSGKASYAAFIDFAVQEVRQNSSVAITSGHILDRIVLKHVAKLGGGGETFDTSVLLPTPFLLAVLNITVQAPPLQRAESLFDVARIIDALKGTSNTEVDSLRGHATVSVDAATQIIAHLADSCQLPGEKQVTVSTQYPLRQYRKKTPAEMVEHYKTLNKDALQLDRITKEELVQLLVSKQICAWGECYRSKP